MLGLDPSLLPRLDLSLWQWLILALLPGVVVVIGMLAIAEAFESARPWRATYFDATLSANSVR